MQKIVLIIILTGTTILSGAQVKRAAHWYFGYRAGLNFTTGTAVADTNGQLISLEGCSAISDTIGNLLFYSNGEQVWNRNGIQMSNSFSLVGDQSSAQSSIIIPKPGDNSMYYLFTTKNGNNGFQYNIIDMNLAAGFGDIISNGKNLPLFQSCAEELASTKHCNNHDYWVVTRQVIPGDTLKFYAYLITGSGVSAPVISKIHTVLLPNDVVGGLTFSQDGSRLIHNTLGYTDIRVLNFNKQNGKISLQTTIAVKSGEGVYSTALSPDGSKLYAASWTLNFSYLAQFNLSAANITASRKNIDSVDMTLGSASGYGYIGQLRLGPDQKIYVNRLRQGSQVIQPTPFSLDSLGVISSPGSPALSCGYQRNGIYLRKRPTMHGLPNFVSNFTTTENKINACTFVSLNELQDGLKISICPNPFSDKTLIDIPNTSFPDIQVNIADARGKTFNAIFTEAPEGLLLDRSDLPAGLYFLTISIKEKKFGARKLIIRD